MKQVILHDSQKTVARDNHRFRVVNCGRRWGKTTLAILEMVGKAMSKRNTKVCYIAPTFQQARDICWRELVSICEPIKKDINETRLEIVIYTSNGGQSTIMLRGWESVETLRGQKFDFMVIDEIAMMRNWWVNWHEVLRPTLTDTKGEVLFISTPKGFNHFYDLFNEEAKDTDFKSFHFSSYDNPHLPKDELDKARKELTEDRFAQEYLADFRKTQGLVYKEFSRERSLYDPATSGPVNIVERYLGIDWGYTNPTAIVEIAKDYDANYWLTGEWLKTGKTTAEVIEYVRTLPANSVYADPAEPDRIEECRRAGLNMREVNKDVVAGIDSVRNLLKLGKFKINKQCEATIQEFETYSYPDKKSDKNENEEPIKENDHLLDALRYVLFMQKPIGLSDRKASIFIPSSIKRPSFIPRPPIT